MTAMVRRGAMVPKLPPVVDGYDQIPVLIALCMPGSRHSGVVASRVVSIECGVVYANTLTSPRDKRPPGISLWVLLSSSLSVARAHTGTHGSWSLVRRNANVRVPE